MKVAWIDRDGTLNQDVPDLQWRTVTEPILLEGCIETLQFLLSEGYQLIMITNQYTIGEKIITLSQYEAFNQKLFSKLKVHGIEFLQVYFCSHAKDENCACCKPKPGMILQACQDFSEIKLNDSLYLGDSIADQQLAKLLNIEFYGIQLDCENRLESLRDFKNRWKFNHPSC